MKITLRDIYANNPCSPARLFLADFKDAKSAFEACHRLFYLLWVLEKFPVVTCRSGTKLLTNAFARLKNHILINDYHLARQQHYLSRLKGNAPIDKFRAVEDALCYVRVYSDSVSETSWLDERDAQVKDIKKLLKTKV